MTFFETPLFVNLVYLALITAIWLAALAILQPGTGALEVLVAVCLLVVSLSTLVLALNLWALLVFLVAGVLFVISLRREKPELWLLLSALAFIAGSVFLFWSPEGGVAVNPILVTIVSVMTLGYFWIAVRSVMVSQTQKPSIDPQSMHGKVGEVRTSIDPVGSVYVGGELWTARSDTPMDVGEKVVIREVNGLVLTVGPIENEAKET
jgi:membrane-bound serine protease (ClpP class)